LVLSSEIHSVLHSIFNAGLKVLLQATYSLRGKMFCFVFAIGNSLLVITICYIFTSIWTLCCYEWQMMKSMALFLSIVYCNSHWDRRNVIKPAGLAINRSKIQVTSWANWPK
jgi:hypothetical protein